jgi:hypothetical protein
MESLPKDIIASTALLLNLSDIAALCETSDAFNKNVCQNDTFWLNKILHDFPNYIDFRDPTLTYKEIYQKIITPKSVEIVLHTSNPDAGNVEEYGEYDKKILIFFPRESAAVEGKYINYVLSVIFDGIVKDDSFYIIVENTDNIYECISRIWKDNNCFNHINYKTKTIKIDAKLKDETYIDYTIDNIENVLNYVTKNLDLPTDQWPPFWL